jgi:hypothetical protein
MRDLSDNSPDGGENATNLSYYVDLTSIDGQSKSIENNRREKCKTRGEEGRPRPKHIPHGGELFNMP